ncbi:MAG TPA: hypothetical protein VMH88_01975 [Gemmatimonadales bacterium]|nr:hypothetical protein [Gemmatimonadales bacterium]
MRSSSPIVLRGQRAAVLLLVAAAACSSSTGLPAATQANTVDTVSLYTLNGDTFPLDRPAGFDLFSNLVVRTDRTTSFDFAFNLTADGKAIFLPTYVLGLARGSGFIPSSSQFSLLTNAPLGGYQDSLPTVLDSGGVAIMRSRPVVCITGTVLYYYGKLHVLAIDTTARRLDLEVLVDRNCGYHSLLPGIPNS